jgi:O-antigen/teichoic acid export membrane protein
MLILGRTMNNYREKTKILINKGFFHIFATNLLNCIIAFLTNIFIVRFMTKGEYGIFSYANNALSLFGLISGLGLMSGLLQFCSEKRSEVEKYALYKHGIKIGVSFNFLLGIGIYIYSIYGNIAISESSQYIKQLMFLPIFMVINQFITIIFRVNKENKKYACLLNLNTVLYFILSCGGAYLYNITGTIMGRYIAYVLSICMGLYMGKKDIKKIINAKKLKFKVKKDLLQYSMIGLGSTSIAELLYLLDVYLIGIFIIDAQVVASYKVATLIPTAVSFIPTSIMVFVYPYIVERNTDYRWIKHQCMKMIKLLAILNGAISIFLFLGAPLIISILWGKEYTDSILPFRILSINYFFLATFRIPCGNILGMLRKVNVNFMVSAISGIANILLNILLIRRYESNGAAVATLLVVIISSVLSFTYLICYLNKNTLPLKVMKKNVI